LLAAQKQVVIPPKANRKAQRPYDRHLYKARHLIENFLAATISQPLSFGLIDNTVWSCYNNCHPLADWVTA